MNPRPSPKKPKSSASALSPLAEQVRDLVQSARRTAAAAVNSLQVLTNFEIGRLIVEHEQKGELRAEYGKGLLKELSRKLQAEFKRGFSEDNLSNMRKFYLVWKDRAAKIPQTPSAEFLSKLISQTPSAESEPISEKPSRKSAQGKKGELVREKPGSISQKWAMNRKT